MHRSFIQLTRRWLALILAALVLSACTESPDAQKVTQTVEERLAQALGPETLNLTSLRRLGSGPLGADGQGRAQRIVYFNAVLTLERDLDFTSWNTLNIAAFATLLGATERGVSGVQQTGNRRGDRVYVHGSTSFVRDGDAWLPVDIVLPEVGTPSAPLSPATSAQSQQLFARLMQLYERQTADPKRQRQIIKEELVHAFETINERLDRLNRTLIIAGGPSGGAYLEVAKLLAQTLTTQGRAADALTTAGSAENLELLRSGRADLALVQNNLVDVLTGQAADTIRRGTDRPLRALASLFPEPVQVLVAKASAIRELRDLVGERVEIGAPDSGSRVNSILLLQAAGVELKDLRSVEEVGLEQGLADLAAGRVDAVITTISAPARLIQDAAARGEVRLLPLSPEVQSALVNERKGLIPFELPPATYPGQPNRVPTLAVTALLVTTDGLSADDAGKVLHALFRDVDFLGAGSAAGSQINRDTATTELTLPISPTAKEFFSNDPAPVP